MKIFNRYAKKILVDVVFNICVYIIYWLIIRKRIVDIYLNFYNEKFFYLFIGIMYFVILIGLFLKISFSKQKYLPYKKVMNISDVSFGKLIIFEEFGLIVFSFIFCFEVSSIIYQKLLLSFMVAILLILFIVFCALRVSIPRLRMNDFFIFNMKMESSYNLLNKLFREFFITIRYIEIPIVALIYVVLAFLITRNVTGMKISIILNLIFYVIFVGSWDRRISSYVKYNSFFVCNGIQNREYIKMIILNAIIISSVCYWLPVLTLNSVNLLFFLVWLYFVLITVCLLISIFYIYNNYNNHKYIQIMFFYILTLMDVIPVVNILVNIFLYLNKLDKKLVGSIK